MSAIVSASSLRSILGVSSSLYNDAYLEDIIDTAQGVILPLLVQNSTTVTAYKLTTNVAYFYTISGHNFVAGDSVVVTKLPSPFNATHTVVDVAEKVFTAALTHADVAIRPIIPNGRAYLTGYDAETYYVGDARVESAILAVSVEVFQSRTAAGGQIEGIDFQVTPYRMGRGLLNRVIGLLGELVDSGALLA